MTSPKPLYIAVAAICALTLTGVQTAEASTFTVNSQFDTAIGGCDAAECTLREAITAANAAPGPDLIAFDIPVGGSHTISLLSSLPEITSPLTIDGTTQPGFSGTPLIEIDGTNAGAGADGLRITAGSSTVRGLGINRFGGDAIELIFNGGSTIAGNRLGTNLAGTADLGNGGRGVFINNTAGNVVGGSTAAARNLISGNTSDGVAVVGGGAGGNYVRGNWIGIAADGVTALKNNGGGVEITGAANNTIGGTTPGTRNVISTNPSGIVISGGTATGNKVQGNFIGTDATGAQGLGDQNDGVFITGSPGNTIGGTTTGAGNVISGNWSSGIELFGAGTDNNVIQGNLIGTDVTGTIGIGNSYHAVEINNGANNVIGGASPASARNVLSGHGSTGIYIIGTSASGNVIRNNLIGTDISGTQDLGNSNGGILISGAPNTIVGGAGPGEGNLISANNSAGITIAAAAATGTIVQGNLIGTDISGGVPLGNFQDGIRINSSSGNTIGGAVPGLGSNVIAASSSDGIEINGATATGNTVHGNYIGTNPAAAPGLGNAGHGVHINGAGENTVGDIDTQFANVIAHNAGDGVRIVTGDLNPVRANSIHTNGGKGVENASGGNNELTPPIVTAADSSISGTACGGCAIDVFSDAEEEGRRYEGTTVAGAGGNWTLAVAPPGPFVTATATNAGNTSEFSTPFACPDTDADAICDAADNCPNTPNPGQQNTVHPATPLGDACEDPDADAVVDATDNCPDHPNPGQQNAVHPATPPGDACEDPDSDAVFDADDNCPDIPNPDQANFEGDAFGDACDMDDDNDLVGDADEQPCGGDPYDSTVRPERVDGANQGSDEDGDTVIDEGLPPSSLPFDCDGDGYNGTTETHVYAPAPDGDQITCGTNASPPTSPPSEVGWPGDLRGGTAFSANKVNIEDLASFTVPVRYVGTDTGTNTGDIRWDLSPGSGLLPTDINVIDMSYVVTGARDRPPMLSGARAFGGPPCPLP